MNTGLGTLRRRAAVDACRQRVRNLAHLARETGELPLAVLFVAERHGDGRDRPPAVVKHGRSDRREPSVTEPRSSAKPRVVVSSSTARSRE